ncbi:MAG: HutD family protein [Synergistaceae bacterium]|jgi:environmental stress-induced protein Ves|nr:HutD family protein [Synergistaceae bacterium]
MKSDVRKKDSLRVAAWSGGRTTELFIYPGDADLAKRNFELRVSSATVEAEESTFSSFAGYVRHITPLTGEMRLVHELREQRREVTLTPLRVDAFEGHWTTRSFGRCVDFNLIHRPNWKGEIYAAPEGTYPCAVDGFTCVYARCGDTRVQVTGEETESVLFEAKLDLGDLLVVETGPELVRLRVSRCPEPAAVAAASRIP